MCKFVDILELLCACVRNTVLCVLCVVTSVMCGVETHEPLCLMDDVEPNSTVFIPADMMLHL